MSQGLVNGAADISISRSKSLRELAPRSQSLRDIRLACSMRSALMRRPVAIQQVVPIMFLHHQCSLFLLPPSFFIITSLTCTVKEKERDRERESKMEASDLDQLLLDAAKAGDASQVRSLIDRNANVNQCNKYYNTPLHLACMHRHGEVACMLIDHNANVNQCNKYNNTPLHLACQYGHVKVACMLIGHNANVNQCNKYNTTPLHWACINGHVEVACMLIDHSANVNQCNNHNNTPLHWACKYGHVEVACMLIDHGADFNIINVCCIDSVTD
jgi:hypothetical protein